MMTIDDTFPMKNWEQLAQFISETYGCDHVLLNKKLFSWLFCTRKDDVANLIVAYESGELISLLGYVPTAFLIRDTIVHGVWMSQWMTKEKYRQGIGALLMRRIKEMFPIAAGQGANAANKPIALKLGFHFLESIPNVVFMIDRNRVAELFDVKFNHIDSKVFDSRNYDFNQFLVSTTKPLPEFDLNKALYPSLCYGTLRNSHYIQRKFIDFPFFDYKVLFSGTAERPVILVARVVDAAMPKPDERRFKVGRILEFFFPEDSAGQIAATEILSAAKQYFIQQGCAYVDFVSTGSVQIQLLLSNGFQPDELGLLPCFLSPVDYKRKKQNLEIYIENKLLKEFPEALDRFYLTRSDGDQDRPTKMNLV